MYLLLLCKYFPLSRAALVKRLPIFSHSVVFTTNKKPKSKLIERENEITVQADMQLQ